MIKNVCLILLAAILLGCQFKNKPIERPNIIFILADDMGYGDIKALNNEAKVETPNLDKLIDGGMSFSDAHSNSALCTPTRYGILTGRYAFRTRLKKGVLIGFDKPLIEDKRPTLASMLRQNDYQTACIGKWHLGLEWTKKDSTESLVTGIDRFDLSNTSNVDYTAPVKGPELCGFEYSYYMPASLDMAPYVYIENGKVTAEVNGHAPNWRYKDNWGVYYRHGDIADDFIHEEVLQNFTDKAVDYINRYSNKEKPFFLYLPLTAPHTPWLPSDKFKGKSGAGSYGDFVMMVDDVLGQLEQALRSNHISENTMVIFTSDNGAHWNQSDIELYNHHANADRRGMKSDAWDGGHRVPLIIKWPGMVKEGSSSKQLVCSTDFYATITDVIGSELLADEAEDSFSFLPALLGRAQAKRHSLIHHSGYGAFAIRKGPWKFIDTNTSGGWSLEEKDVPDNSPGAQLYNLETDCGETRNVLDDYPDVLNDLRKELTGILEK
ncbi:MAG: arylsulfatase [Bacteroidales bacterium]|nr:arylsulfatase [Bacteroidales bacterium]